MTTLAKGLTVLAAFGRQRPAMTLLSEAADVAGLSRATARRVLHLGAARLRGAGRACLHADVACSELGFAYLSGQNWIDRALPLMKDLSERLGESCSGSILQGTEVVTSPAFRASHHVDGACGRKPAAGVSHRHGPRPTGFLDDMEIWRRLRSVRIEPYTPYTITDLQALFERVRLDHEQGFAIVDESSSAACARLQCRRSTATDRRLAPSTCRHTRPAPPATKCATCFCPSCARSQRTCRNNAIIQG